MFGSSRDAQIATLGNLGVDAQVRVESMGLNDFRSVLQTVAQAEPDEVYNLAGQSSVGLSFEQPVETLESIGIGMLNLLEAIRFLEGRVRFYNACSGECFGDTGEHAADEESPFRPRSPYAVAKAGAHNGGQLPRGLRFVRVLGHPVQPRVAAAARPFRHAKDRLRPPRASRTAAARRCGWATSRSRATGDGHPNTFSPCGRCSSRHGDDYVIASGRSASLEHFVSQAFAHFGLDWQRMCASIHAAAPVGHPLRFR